MEEKKLSTDELIKAVIKKVRGIYKYNSKYAGIILQKAEVTLREVKNGEFEIVCIEFNDYDSISVHNDAIYFTPEYGKSVRLNQYPSLEEFLNM